MNFEIQTLNLWNCVCVLNGFPFSLGSLMFTLATSDPALSTSF